MHNFLFIIANQLEKIAFNIKKRENYKILKLFLDKYSLTDGVMKKKIDVRYNPYERTSLLLVDELIDSGVIQKNEMLLDVGCGAGIFLIYLASKGFNNLYGIELDTELYLICQKNIESYRSISKDYENSIQIKNNNAILDLINDNITCFYLFNTFYDKDTYLEWLSLVKESISRNPRKIKIILLYPTVASMGAMRTCKWLHEKQRVVCNNINCKKCLNFLIYESDV